jgi:hypothetical protein
LYNSLIGYAYPFLALSLECSFLTCAFVLVHLLTWQRNPHQSLTNKIFVNMAKEPTSKPQQQDPTWCENSTGAGMKHENYGILARFCSHFCISNSSPPEVVGFFFQKHKKTFLQQSPSQVAIYLNFEKRVSRVYMGTYLQRIDIKIILFLSCNTQKF